MKRLSSYFYIGFLLVFLMSCEKDDNIEEDPVVPVVEDDELEVEEFIFRGMEEFYLYEADIAALQDGFFEDDSEKKTFLGSFDSPEELFYDLTIPSDQFSFITDNYNALNDSFDGKSGATGMEYGIGRITGTSRLFGFITYILPGSSAEEAGLERGTVFTEINGTALTDGNYLELLREKSFTINIGSVDEEGYLVLTDETVELEDRPYTSNPIFLYEIMEFDEKKIGYLIYNSFIGDFDDELNAVFGEFKSAGIDDLILDLRYNGGGSVMSAVDLASMITGQFEGEVFMKEQWNERYQTYFETYEPERILNYFDSQIRTGEAINSLHLSEIYILTGYQTASASELIINGLRPYINVIQIGEETTGKFQGSITLYDAPNFDEENANPDHTYALQPLVFTSANVNGETGYMDGLYPDIEQEEMLNNMGVLGDQEEPLLKTTLDIILDRPEPMMMRSMSIEQSRFEIIGGKELIDQNSQRMYLEKTPPKVIWDQE